MDKLAIGVGQIIRQLRHKQGLTQEGLGERTNLHYTYIGGIERGERNPSLKIMEKIAQGLKVNLAELFRGLEQEPKPPTKTEYIQQEVVKIFKEQDKKTRDFALGVLRDALRWKKKI